MLSNISIKNRMYFILIMMTILFMAMSTMIFINTKMIKNISVRNFHNIMYEDQKAKLYTATHSLALSIGEIIRDIPDEEEKKKMIRKLVYPIRFEEDKSGYFFVYEGTVNIALPINKALEGKDIGGLKDKNGKLFIKELVEKGMNGGGFVEYVFLKPGFGDQPKLTYSERIPGSKYGIGTGIYIDNIIKTETSLSNTIDSMSRKRIFVFTAMFSLLFIGVMLPICINIVRTISKSLREVNETAEKVAHGELNTEFNITGKDEINELKTNLNSMTASLGVMVKGLTSGIETLFSSSENVSDISNQIFASANATSDKSQSVAAAAREMSETMASIATAMEEAAGNVGIVVKSTEKMASNFEQIVQNTEKAGEISNNAVAESKGALDNINKLSSAAVEIGNVTESITDISDQTNLLALNATIEAARAGEAGKGFAVVANEIKNLARQTAEATQEIKAKVTAIQGSTTDTMKRIEQITGTINELNTIIAIVTGVIKEQADTTKQITERINHASLGIHEVSENCATSSMASQEITKDITDVNKDTITLTDNSSNLNKNAEQLSTLAVQLKEMAKKFKF